MSKQIVIGLSTEGPTDIRFLESIVKRTFQDIAYKECPQDVDIYVHPICVNKTGLAFPEYARSASRYGVSTYGIMVLAIHTDADRDTYDERYSNKIVPAQQLLDSEDKYECCKNLIPIIPVRMIEAWMLADTSLLKDEIGTHMSDTDLGINKDPETYADPKQVIESAIRIATSDLPKRRPRISIAELYGILGDTISLDKLLQQDSYKKFHNCVRQAYKTLHYIY
ncbi:MAG: DUF4276 family protein [Alistipes sp.]|nr:DUF4276 family protein [Alistipes sp.]